MTGGVPGGPQGTPQAMPLPPNQPVQPINFITNPLISMADFDAGVGQDFLNVVTVDGVMLAAKAKEVARQNGRQTILTADLRAARLLLTPAPVPIAPSRSQVYLVRFQRVFSGLVGVLSGALFENNLDDVMNNPWTLNERFIAGVVMVVWALWKQFKSGKP